MKRAAILLAIATAWASPAPAQTLAIVHAKAWTMTGPAPVDDATILIDGRTIVSVTANGPVPAGVPVIDAAGAVVTPGFVNSATQLGLIEVSSAQDTRDVTAKPPISGASFDVSRALNGNSALIALARSDGLTRAVSFPDPSPGEPFSGLAAMVRLREGADILDQPGVALFAVIGGNAEAGSRGAQWERLRTALDDARKPPGTSRREDDAMVVRRVLAREIPLAIVTHRESDIRQAILLAQDYNIRLIVVGAAEAWRAADALAAAHIAVVIDPEANLPLNFDQLGSRQDNAAILSRAGVTVAFGLTGGRLVYNYNAGMSLRETAGIAVANGMPYVEALKAVTVNPSTLFGTGKGTLAPGSDADLVIWDGDPLEPSTNTVAVVIEGRRVSLANRQSELAERYAERVK